MTRILLSLLACICVVTTAQAQRPCDSLAMHNYSLMCVRTPTPRIVTIEYVEPKPDLLEIGVRPGTLLFNGEWRGNVLVGRARVFNLVCGSVPYDVEGVVQPDGVLVLRGPQLRVNQFCRPYYLEWTQNSELVFLPLETPRGR
jgi:hypothetical protein